MNEPMHGALAGVVDRCASAAEPEPSFFGRIPVEVQPRRDIGPGPKFLLSVLDRLARQFGPDINTTDPQLAKECGVTINTISNWLRKLAAVGLIERVGRTCRRIIRLVFRFRSAPPTPKIGGSQLPQEPGDTTPGTATNYPRKGDELAQKPGSSLKDQRNKKDKAPASSSSPGAGDTPTPAKTKTADTPPTPAPPPLIESRRSEAEAIDARDAALRARWDELPPADRAAIEAGVRAADPMLATFPPMFRSLCLAAMEARPGPGADQKTPAAIDKPAIPAPVIDKLPAVEVLPTDRQLRFEVAMLGADDLAARLAALASLRECGRSDLIPAGYDPRANPRHRRAIGPEKTPAGRTLASPPAGA